MKDIGKIKELVSKGNKIAFDKFYDQYYEKVFHFAYYFLKEKESCKEIVSDVFFSVWKNRAGLKEIIDIDSWLYVLTKNRSLRYLSQVKKNVVSYNDDAFSVTIQLKEEGGWTPEDALLNREMEEILADAINLLPEKCRAIFIMSRKSGLKTKEIAEILQIQESTVRVQLKIATGKMLAFLKPRFPELFC